MLLIFIVHYYYIFSCVLIYFCYSLAPLSTVGVDLGLWKYRKDLEPSYRGKKSVPLRSVTFYTWDFGGQVCVCVCAWCIVNVAIQSSTVQYNECLYLFV